jgi:hypothetical protein
MDQAAPEALTIPADVAARVVANIDKWLSANPENDQEWLAVMAATREIREDFEALLADNGISQTDRSQA